MTAGLGKYLAAEWAPCPKPLRILSIGRVCVQVKLLQAAEKFSEEPDLGY